MRKISYFCLLIVGLLVFTGCGNKKSLKCSRNNDYNDQLSMEQVLNIVFKSDKLSSLSMDMNVSLTDDYVDFKNSLIESAESEFKDIDSKAIKYSTKETSNGFKFNVKINYNKLSDEEKDELYIVDYEKDYDALKADLVEAGYNCK